MKKQIIALIAVAATLATLLTVPVGAEVFVNDTFDTPPTSGNITDLSGWVAYDNVATNLGDSSFEDGALKLQRSTPENGSVKVRRVYTLTASTCDHILMWDAKFSDTHKVLWSLCQGTGNSGRILQSSVNTGKIDTWFTFMIVVSDDGKKADLYWKERDVSGSLWNTTSNTGSSAATRTTTTFNLFINASGGYTLNGYMLIDNFRVFNGENIVSNDFKLDTTKLTTKLQAVTDVTSGGMLKSECEIYSGDVTFDAGVLRTNKTVKAILVAFDKDGKMVGCSTENKDVKGGLTTLAPTLAIDETDAAAIKDNGYIATYIWNGMQPICDTVDLGTAPISSTHSDN